jgi:RNase P/RNase MRP subunit POP5
MVVKSKIGRRRYIVFKIVEGDDITRKDLIYTFNRSIPKEPDDKSAGVKKILLNSNSMQHNQKSFNGRSKKNEKLPVLQHRLKYFDGQFGIILTPHWQKPEAIIILKKIERIGILNKPIKIEPIGTSGSIKKAMKKYLG